jgi:hypothetical protein
LCLIPMCWFCFEGSLHFSDQSVYYIYLCLFIVIVVPFGFFNFQKTRILQYITMGIRNFALFTYSLLFISNCLIRLLHYFYCWTVNDFWVFSLFVCLFVCDMCYLFFFWNE